MSTDRLPDEIDVVFPPARFESSTYLTYYANLLFLIPGDLLGLRTTRPPLRLLFRDDCDAAPLEIDEVERFRLGARLEPDFMPYVFLRTTFPYGVDP